MIKMMAETSTLLTSRGVYLDFSLDNIQLSPMRNMQAYWGDVKAGNAHRQFYRKMLKESINIGIMAP